MQSEPHYSEKQKKRSVYDMYTRVYDMYTRGGRRAITRHTQERLNAPLRLPRKVKVGLAVDPSLLELEIEAERLTAS